MTRSSWVQDPKTGKLVPKEEWLGEDNPSHYVQGDIEPFISPITREVITSRNALRSHNVQHGVTDSRDYSRDYLRRRSNQRIAEMTGQTKQAKGERLALIRRALDER